MQELFENIPENLKSQYPFENGLLKLLSNLKTDKAAGPDDIKHMVLKELRNEITPVI